MPPVRVWLVRHGESTANIGQHSANHADIQLTERGHEQALAVVGQIAERPDLVVVSPFSRTLSTAQPLLARWPDTPVQTWPIEEFSYLDPARANNTSVAERRPLVQAYWQRADADFVDGLGAESFAHLVERVQAFHQRLLQQRGRVVVFGHGQFLRAFLLHLEQRLHATSAGMTLYRQEETASPVRNGQVIEISMVAPVTANEH